jgi:hypothetical protein
VKATELPFRPGNLTVGITPRQWNFGKSFLKAGEFQPEFVSHPQASSDAIKEKSRRRRTA